MNLSVQEFGKLVYICRSYDQNQVYLFFWIRCTFLFISARVIVPPECSVSTHIGTCTNERTRQSDLWRSSKGL